MYNTYMLYDSINTTVQNRNPYTEHTLMTPVESEGGKWKSTVWNMNFHFGEMKKYPVMRND